MKETLAELIATRTVLQYALKRISADQRVGLIEEGNELLAELKKRWASSPSPLSDFQHGFLKELERINFRISQFREIAESDDPIQHEPSYLCIRCGAPILAIGTDTVCPDCGTADWIEAVHI